MTRSIPLIVVVDDDPDYLTMMSSLLPLLGYQALFSSSSDRICELIGREQPDGVILDLRMGRPRMGLELLDRLRAQTETAQIPVIMASAETTFLRSQAQALLEKGCATLEKPFSLLGLRAVLQASLQRGQVGMAKSA